MDNSEKEQVLKAVRFLEMLVVSLDRIGTYAAIQGVDDAKIVSDFIDDFDVFRGAAEARTVLCEFFDQSIPDGQDCEELELLLRDVKYWTAPSK